MSFFRLLVAACAALSCSIASAASVAVFDFRNDGTSVAWSRVFTDGDLQLTVTAGVQEVAVPAGVSQTNEGLGVWSADIIFPGHVDNVLADEFLRFAFDPSVHVTSVQFTAYGFTSSLRQFSYKFDDGDWASGQISSGGSFDFGALNSEISSFYLGARIGQANDYFKVGVLTVEYEPTPVPTPGTLALLGLSLAGLGLARRRG